AGAVRRHAAHRSAVQVAGAVGDAGRQVAAVGRRRAGAARRHARGDAVAARHAELVELAGALVAGGAAAVVGERVRRAAAVAEVMADVALGLAGVLARRLAVGAVVRVRLRAGADGRVLRIGHALDQARAGQAARRVAAAAVGVLGAEIAEHVAARRRLADLRAARAEGRAVGAAAAAAAVAGAAAVVARGLARGRQRLARAVVAVGGAAGVAAAGGAGLAVRDARAAAAHSAGAVEVAAVGVVGAGRAGRQALADGADVHGRVALVGAAVAVDGAGRAGRAAAHAAAEAEVIGAG